MRSHQRFYRPKHINLATKNLIVFESLHMQPMGFNSFEPITFPPFFMGEEVPFELSLFATEKYI